MTIFLWIVFSFFSRICFCEIFIESNSSGAENFTEVNALEVTKVVENSTAKTDILVCDQLKGLSTGQVKHCQLYEDHMNFVAIGIKTSLDECYRQFKYHRWNCTSLAQHLTFFGPNLKSGNRETAFLQAITSAGVMHSIARSCRDGQLSRCGCSTVTRPANLHKDWVWRGCGDNLEYAYKFTRNLMDIKEQEKIPRIKNDENEYSRSLMALHNKEAGRRAVLKMTRVTCKCHGVSGSCTLITCWHQMPFFSEIGDYIKKKYQTAIKVMKNKKGRLQVRNASRKKSKVTDLVYVNQSPSYCHKNESIGILGIQHRECKKMSNNEGNCDTLCCGRGYHVQKVYAKEKCKCQFHWCCFVQCESCTTAKEINLCK